MSIESSIGMIVTLTVLIGGILGNLLTRRRERHDIQNEVRPRKGDLK